MRGRFTGLARGWGGGNGPRAVLACPSGELHDLGLMMFGITLRHRGWRIAYCRPALVLLGIGWPGGGVVEVEVEGAVEGFLWGGGPGAGR
jgi:hypothetical protein